MKNSADRGGCYPARPKAELDNTLRDLQNSSYPAIAEILQIKVCSGLQIYSKYQLLSVELTSRYSCYVFRQYFAVKRVQCPLEISAILFRQQKQLNFVPKFPRSTVQYDKLLNR